MFKKFKAMVELQCGYHVKKLRTDKGGEFISNDFEKFCEDLGIERQPGIKHLKVFGSVCYPFIPGNLRHKLEATSAISVFIGYGVCEKGYRILNPATQKFCSLGM